MLEDMIHSQEQLPIDEIASSPLPSQLFEFCESDLFPETLQNSEVASNSNCCYEDHSSYPTHLSITPEDINKYNNRTNTHNEMRPAFNAGPTTPSAATARNGSLSVIFDPTGDQIENDISASIDFNPSPSFSIPQHHQYLVQNNQEPFGGFNNQLSFGDHAVDGSSQHMSHQYAMDPQQMVVAAPQPVVVPMSLGPPFQTVYEEECGQMPSIPSSYARWRTNSPACALIDPMITPYLPSGNITAPFSTESSGIFPGNGLMLGTDISHQELEFQGDSAAFFLPDSVPRFFNSELQALSSESQHQVHGGTNSINLTSEISSFEDSTYKVGKLSVEERRRKIHRYLKKRNERNFTKKIKYACRKTLADSRPRVRGRFAKNDESGELCRTNTGSNQEYDTDEDVSLCSNRMPDRKRKMKEEEDLDSSEVIFAQLNGVNSLKCNYPIQSWI